MAADNLLVIPTYNEKENILEFLRAVFQARPDLDVLVVDDNSPDGTARIVEERYASDPLVTVMRREGPRGLGRSYVDGYGWALARGYSRVIQMDADFSHNPKYLDDLLAASYRADVVFGSRYCPGGGVQDWPLRRKLLSRFANRYVATVAAIPIKDATSGFRCYSRASLERIGVDDIISNGYSFQVEMSYRVHRAGLTIAEVPIVFTDRTLGKSKMSGGVIFESVLMPWKLRFGRRRPAAATNP